jgi:hypothetical protein
VRYVGEEGGEGLRIQLHQRPKEKKNAHLIGLQVREKRRERLAVIIREFSLFCFANTS